MLHKNPWLYVGYFISGKQYGRIHEYTVWIRSSTGFDCSSSVWVQFDYYHLVDILSKFLLFDALSLSKPVRQYHILLMQKAFEYGDVDTWLTAAMSSVIFMSTDKPAISFHARTNTRTQSRDV